ncbi:MAG: hypothetical protein SFW65_03800 [Alphaproteobacteria bacterium]|nr:hypothetical protein [Alphaproteobacteria bacterium]
MRHYYMARHLDHMQDYTIEDDAFQANHQSQCLPKSQAKSLYCLVANDDGAIEDNRSGNVGVHRVGGVAYALVDSLCDTQAQSLAMHKRVDVVLALRLALHKRVDVVLALRLALRDGQSGWL